MVSFSKVFGGVSITLSLIFYVIAIGVEWGTFNNYGGSTTGSIVISIPIGVACVSFCIIMICSPLCSCDENTATYFAAGCSAFICCCGGVIAFVGGGLLIAAGVHNRMEMDIFNGSITAGVFSILSGIAFYLGMIALLYAYCSDSKESSAPGDRE